MPATQTAPDPEKQLIETIEHARCPRCDSAIPFECTSFGYERDNSRTAFAICDQCGGAFKSRSKLRHGVYRQVGRVQVMTDAERKRLQDHIDSIRGTIQRKAS